jgi:CubicO group peptidase (beta-lactamase class C family)
VSFFDEISELIRVRADSGSFSGVVALEEKGERILEVAHGFAHRGWQIPNTIDTRFRVASIGKMSTAVGVLQLVEAGRVDLNASLVQLLDFTGNRISRDVTVEHLLFHTSGISDWVDEESLTDEIWEAPLPGLTVAPSRRQVTLFAS